jgi:hypothetical protein
MPRSEELSVMSAPQTLPNSAREYVKHKRLLAWVAEIATLIQPDDILRLDLQLLKLRLPRSVA